MKSPFDTVPAAQKAPEHEPRFPGAERAEGWVSYELQRELARGGMGQIYEGYDQHLVRRVAIKVSANKSRQDDPRFIREAQVLARLAHPNIVPIYNLGQDESGRPCYSMKLVRGETLQAILDAKREKNPTTTQEYPIERLLGVFLKICDALAFAHAQGVLHRDLKPENVMVGEFGEVLVMDWGVAKIQGEEPQAVVSDSDLDLEGPTPGETLDGEVIGTPGYLSPEQALGRIDELDERTDVFGLGGILHAILTLHPPVEGQTLLDILIKSKRGNISRRLSNPRESQIPSALQAVTLKALADKPERRYQNVGEMARDIENYRNGFATRAEDASLIRQLLLLVTRHRTLAAMLGLLLLSGIIFTLRLGASEQRARESATAAIAEREIAKREAARVLLAPIETAMRDHDGEEMQRMLADVPEDLRGQQWHYLKSTLNTANLTSDASDQSPFLAATPHPLRANLFFTLQENGIVRSFDASTGYFSKLFAHEGPSSKSALLSVSADSYKIALVRESRSGANIEIRSLPGGDVVMNAVSSNSISRAFFNPAGTLLFCCTQIKGKGWLLAEAWDVATGTRQSVLEGYLFGDDSGEKPKLYAVSKNKIITEIDLETGKPLGEQPQIDLNESIRHINFSFGHLISPDAKVLFTVGGGQTLLRRINIPSGAVKYESLVSQGKLAGMSWVDSSKMVATLSQRSPKCAVLQLWQPENGALCRTILSPGIEGNAFLSVHQISGQAAVFQKNRIKVWNLHETAPAARLEGIATNAPWFAFLPNTPYAAQNLPSGGFQLVERQSLNGSEFSVVSKSDKPGIPSLSADGSTLLLSQRLGTPDQPTDCVRVLRRSGATFIEQTNFSQPRWGEAASPRVLSPDGKHFVSMAPPAPTVYVTATGGLVHAFKLRDSKDAFVNTHCFWLDQRRFLTFASTKDDRPWSDPTAVAEAIQVWDVQTGELLKKTFASKVGLLCGSPDGKLIAEGGTDLRLRLRDSATLDVEREFRVHDTPIKCMVWHPTLPILVTGGDDSAVRAWDTRNGSLLKQFEGIPFPRQLHLSADGKSLCVIQKSSATAKIYPLNVSITGKP